TIYSLRIMQKIFFESYQLEVSFPDLNAREMLITIPMVAMILWLGLYPQPFLETARPSIQEQLQAYTKPVSEREELPLKPENMAHVLESKTEASPAKPE